MLEGRAMTFLTRFKFLAAVLVTVLLLGGAVLVKSLSGPSQADATKSGGRPSAPPTIVAGTLELRPFVDIVQAIGTARANESIEISAKVTDTIQRINFESGDRVARGKVLVELASVEQTAELAEALAALEAQRREFERFSELGELGFAPEARVEAARAAYEQAQARIEALQSRIADRVIRAPFSGVIGLRTASPGALVRPGDVIGTLDDVSRIKLDFDIPESRLADVALNAPVFARSAAYPEQVFEGQVANIDTRVDPDARTLKVRAMLPNPNGAIKPGMLLTVELNANPRDALGVPESALLERADGAYILALEGDGAQPTVRQVLVKTGRRAGGYAEILEGAMRGTRLVVEGVQRARSGQTVSVQGAVSASGSSPPRAASDRAR